MNDRNEGPAPFDESAALNELARLRQAIERRREEREAAAGRFEEFLQSFPAEAPRVEPAPSVRPMEAAPRRPNPIVPFVHPPTPVAERRPGSPKPSAPRKPVTGSRWRGAVVLLLGVGALGLWLWRQQAGSPGEASPGAVAPPAESVTAAPPPDPIPTAAPGPAAAAAAEPGPLPATAPASLQMEITTTRLVWLRVLADGKRVLEQRMPADSRVPVTAEKTIVIRTGDAGAVRVSVGGRDQGFLGGAGRVVTRTFTPGGETR